MAEMTPIFLLEEDEEPMATQPIKLSNDESQYSILNSTPDHHHESNNPDSINQLMTSQLEQRSNKGTKTVFHPPTPTTSMISDDEEQSNPTLINGNLYQYTSQIPQRRNHPKQLCQQLQPVPDMPESPLPGDQGQRDFFRPYDLLNPSKSASYNSFPNISTVAAGMQNLTLHPHPEPNEWVTPCLVLPKII